MFISTEAVLLVAFQPTHQQQMVIAHDPTRHGRVLAGPGTGKSTTTVALAKRLPTLDHPPRVKFVTFTRAATAELAKKVYDAGEHSTFPSTVHSFAISVVLRNPGCASIPQPLRIADDWEWAQLIRPHLAEIVGVDVRMLDRLDKEMAAKWESLDPSWQDVGIPPEARDRFVAVFNSHRRVFGYTTLAELPDLLRCALRDYPVLTGIDYDLLLVDEYQDLNACDLEVLRRLASRGTQIVAIGDDDQSIYSFRKAHPEGIRRFMRDFPGADDYALTFCHRFAAGIGRWAQAVIKGDPHRIARPELAYGDAAPPGSTALLGFRSTAEEARGVADLIQGLGHRGVEPSEVIILFRGDFQHRFSKPIREELERRGLPVVDVQEAKSLMEQQDTRRLLAILQLCINNEDSLAWRALMHLTPGIGEQAVHYLFSEAFESGTGFGSTFVRLAPNFAGAKAVAASRLAQLWTETEGSISAVSNALPHRSAEWGKVVVDLIKGHVLPECSDGLQQLLLDADETDEMIALSEFVARFGLRLREMIEARQDGVRCMTMAASKGLTARACIVVGVEDDLIPRANQDLAEETRLLYVAMTRATEYLFVTWVERRQGPAARSGRPNTGRRHASDLLRGGPVESQPGPTYCASFRAVVQAANSG